MTERMKTGRWVNGGHLGWLVEVKGDDDMMHKHVLVIKADDSCQIVELGMKAFRTKRGLTWTIEERGEKFPDAHTARAAERGELTTADIDGDFSYC